MIRDEDLARAEQRVLAAIADIRRCLTDIEGSMANGHTLNERGELQQLGPQLDAAIAIYLTLREVRREYDSGRAEVDALDLDTLSAAAVFAAWLAQDATPLAFAGPRAAGRRDALLRSRAEAITHALTDTTPTDTTPPTL